jgi:hypothetical protein
LRTAGLRDVFVVEFGVTVRAVAGIVPDRGRGERASRRHDERGSPAQRSGRASRAPHRPCSSSAIRGAGAYAAARACACVSVRRSQGRRLRKAGVTLSRVRAR